MSYQTYITEALVCGSGNSKTADRSFLLFTREMGMVYAHARSVREERSKHRYALQDCSHIRVSLVRGKGGWKITGAESIQNLYMNAPSRDARIFLRNTVLLLRRIIHGETQYAEIFDDVMCAWLWIDRCAHEKLETVLFLRILHALGYIAPHEEYRQFLHCALPHDRIRALSNEDMEYCKQTVAHALLESHL